MPVSPPCFGSVPDALRECARRQAAARAIVCQDRSIDYATLDRLTDAAAAALAARGIAPGDRVALYCINSDAFVIAYFGILKAGAIVVPVNLLLSPAEIAFILRDSGARALVYFDAFGEAVAAACAAVDPLALRVCIGAAPADPGDVPWPELLGATGPAPAIAVDPARDTAVILYTSGTTGRPKGAMLTHRNLVANAWSCRQAIPLVPGEDIILVVLPMFHAFAAMVGILFPLLHGFAIVPLPRFEPVQVANTIESERVTFFMAVPSMYSVLLRLPEEYTPRFALLKYCVSGGAAMPGEVMRAFETRFGKPVYEGDGPTECSPVTCVNPIGGLRKPFSVGIPVPLVEMEIRNEAGEEVGLGEVGEICVRGPNVMKGYWNLPEDTQAAFFGDWFRTGDLGTRDGDGYFFIVDRKKDMIIVNGMNVYPRTVEEHLYKHPAIHEAAVVGEPHDLHGEIPVAYVSLVAGAHASAAEIRAFCRQALGRHEVPKKVFIREALPKNAAGKIVKRELRKHGEIERGIDSRT